MEITLAQFDDSWKELSFRWLQQEELRALIEAPSITHEQQDAWFKTLANRMDYKIWGVVYNHIPVGVCGLKNINEQQAEYWGYIGVMDYWGKGIGSKMMEFMEEKARGLKLKTLVLKVAATNKRAIRLYEKAKFQPLSYSTTHLMMEKIIPY
ncbi:MAG TPA: GNAT family N-acetyltransferase [Flavipsychrobacter sp.]|nr:GNAT family N-acetyltransferase [Flavipsychrobacter sp.]